MFIYLFIYWSAVLSIAALEHVSLIRRRSASWRKESGQCLGEIREHLQYADRPSHVRSERKPTRAGFELSVNIVTFPHNYPTSCRHTSCCVLFYLTVVITISHRGQGTESIQSGGLTMGNPKILTDFSSFQNNTIIIRIKDNLDTTAAI